MLGFGLSFHHLGLAVRRADEAVGFLRGLGYRIGEPVFDTEQNVNLIMCSHDSMPDVEVISPGNNSGPVDNLVDRFSSGIVYHACYVTDNMEASVAAIRKVGLRVIPVSKLKPAVLFGGRRVSFHVIAGMGLVEIIEGADPSRLEVPAVARPL
jgi:catechol 2,3-dioxygenase-like lactoylglutathione lyase family enzyme